MAAARVLMIQGTASGVGKSTIVAGLCRLFARRGVRVAPFKALNVSLNSAVTPDGLEIARSQAVQARAAGIEPTVEMNPVLLKPQKNGRSQYVVMGKPGRPSEEVVRDALRKLRERHDLVILEGMGCAVEPNLRDRANMSVARIAGAPVLLVASLEMGGAFASLLGTWTLLGRDRGRVRGFLLNRAGRRDALEPAIRDLRRRTGVPVVGVIPELGVRLAEEDTLRPRPKDAPIRIDVVRFPHLSNFTDFEPLELEPDVSVRYVDRPDGDPDVLILPGTKCVAEDLEVARRFPMIAPLVLGICGGLQMLGRRIRDPHGIESPRRLVESLGLLDFETTLRKRKRTVRTEGTVWGLPVRGYEIRHGSGEDLWIEKGNVCGTVLHGIFDAPDFRAEFLNRIRRRRGLPERGPAARGESFDVLADALERSVDPDAIEPGLPRGRRRNC